MEPRSGAAVLLNPFCPFSTAKVLALKATVLLLLTLLIKAKIRITAFSALGFLLLLLQTLVFLALRVLPGDPAVALRWSRAPEAILAMLLLWAAVRRTGAPLAWRAISPVSSVSCWLPY